jgi:hypothetical protein
VPQIFFYFSTKERPSPIKIAVPRALLNSNPEREKAPPRESNFSRLCRAFDDNKCVITGRNFHLVAAHIIPRSSSHRVIPAGVSVNNAPPLSSDHIVEVPLSLALVDFDEPRNSLTLWKELEYCFDRGLLWFDSTLRVCLADDLKRDPFIRSVAGQV